MLISSNNNKGEECIYVAERMYLEPIPIRKYPQHHKCKAKQKAHTNTGSLFSKGEVNGLVENHN